MKSKYSLREARAEPLVHTTSLELPKVSIKRYLRLVALYSKKKVSHRRDGKSEESACTC